MKIDKYITIPKKKQPYISYLELLISLSSGVIAICILKIYHESDQNILSITPLLFIGAVMKTVIVLNYCVRRNLSKGKHSSATILQNMAKIKISELVIPALVKTMAYFGFILAVLNYQSLLVSIAIILNLLMNQFINLRMKYSRKVTLASVMIYLIIGVSLIISTVSADQFSFAGWKLHTIIFSLIGGWLIPVAFFYLHREIFNIYQSGIDELLSKEYIIETLNFLIVLFLYAIGNNEDFLLHLKQIWNYPLLCLFFAVISVVYEICMLQLISKAELKYVFLTMVSGSFWLNLYIFIKNSQFNAALLLSTILGSLALIAILRVFSHRDIDKLIYRFGNPKQAEQQQN